jgi:Family of unknown function (DUF6166)
MTLTDTNCHVKYVGVRSVDGDLYEVVVERLGQKPYKLNWRNDIRDHSPTGISWGYGGSGPAQCALAILADYLKDDLRAESLYMDFKWAYIAKLDQDAGFELTERELENFITKITLEQLSRA